ncbi:MAG: hypothetical protein H0U86_15760 [Chloroflexi bacterium]|nr:hypothetical protein [Chloroflexota bacterium]
MATTEGHQGLTQVDGFPFPVYASDGAGDRAAAAATQAREARDWLVGRLEGTGEFTLFVVGPNDWEQVAEVPIYGMPHSWVDKVVMGNEPAPFWAGVRDLLWPDLSEATRDRLRSTYGDPADISPFADLVVVHEIVHLFHHVDATSGATDFPSLWLSELFANLGTYGYLAENEPGALPTLMTIAEASAEVDVARLPVHALADMERAFEHENGAEVYGWYQLRLITWAERIWNAGGPGVLRAFSDEMRSPEMPASEIEAALSRVHPAAAQILGDWPA